jgi:hypothetical protein
MHKLQPRAAAKGRHTDRPIMNPLVRGEYDDPESRISLLPGELVACMIDRMAVPPAPGVVVPADNYVATKFEMQFERGEWAVLCRVSAGNKVVVVVRDSGRVVVLDLDGRPLHTFTLTLPNGDHVTRTYPIAVYADGGIAVMDDWSVVRVFSATGVYCRSMGDDALDPSFSDCEIAVDECDNTYVCNNKSMHVTIYGPSGEPPRTVHCGMVMHDPLVHSGTLYFYTAGNNSVIGLDLQTGCLRDTTSKTGVHGHFAVDATGCIIAFPIPECLQASLRLGDHGTDSSPALVYTSPSVDGYGRVWAVAQPYGLFTCTASPRGFCIVRLLPVAE